MKHLTLPNLATVAVSETFYESGPIAATLAKKSAAMAEARTRKDQAVAALETAQRKTEAAIKAAAGAAARFTGGEIVGICDSDAEALSSAYAATCEAWQKYDEETWDPRRYPDGFTPNAEFVRVPDVAMPTNGNIRKYKDTVGPALEMIRGCLAAFDAEAAARRELDAAEAAERSAREAFSRCAQRILEMDSERSAYLAALSDFSKEADAARAEWRARMKKELAND